MVSDPQSPGARLRERVIATLEQRANRIIGRICMENHPDEPSQWCAPCLYKAAADALRASSASEGAPADKRECNYIPISSRVCERGTSGCTVKHGLAWVNDVAQALTQAIDWPTLTRFQQEQRMTRAYLTRLERASPAVSPDPPEKESTRCRVIPSR